MFFNNSFVVDVTVLVVTKGKVGVLSAVVLGNVTYIINTFQESYIQYDHE